MTRCEGAEGTTVRMFLIAGHPIVEGVSRPPHFFWKEVPDGFSSAESRGYFLVDRCVVWGLT
jgi:hypothetical protein